jgi:hypothetical protein
MRSIDYVDDYAARFRCFGGDGGGGGGGGGGNSTDPTQGYGNTDDPDDTVSNPGSVSPNEGLGPNDGPSGGAGLGGNAPSLTTEQLMGFMPAAYNPTVSRIGNMGFMAGLNQALNPLSTYAPLSHFNEAGKLGYGLGKVGSFAVSPVSTAASLVGRGAMEAARGVTTTTSDVAGLAGFGTSPHSGTSPGPGPGPGPDDGGGPTPLQQFLLKANA